VGFFFIKNLGMKDSPLGGARAGSNLVNRIAGILALPGSLGEGGGEVKKMGNYRGLRAVR
jgi:hypothetical protein